MKFVQGQIFIFDWVPTVFLTSFALSMAVNTLVTGLIVFKILKVFLEVNATVTSVERTLGSTGGTKLWQIIFIIIESGMALFAVQLVRVVLSILGSQGVSNNFQISSCLVIGINQMLNVIIINLFISTFIVLLTTLPG